MKVTRVAENNQGSYWYEDENKVRHEANGNILHRCWERWSCLDYSGGRYCEGDFVVYDFGGVYNMDTNQFNLGHLVSLSEIISRDYPVLYQTKSVLENKEYKFISGIKNAPEDPLLDVAIWRPKGMKKQYNNIKFD